MPCGWFAKFSTTVIKLGFQNSSYDSNLFVSSYRHGLILLLFYVNDMIITGDDSHGSDQLKSTLHTLFKMKILGPLSYFLEIGVVYSPRGYILSETKYTLDLIDRAGLTDTLELLKCLLS